MKLQDIKTAIERGFSVYWKNANYEVIKDNLGEYLIRSHNGHCIGLTWTDGTTLNGREQDFYQASGSGWRPHPGQKLRHKGVIRDDYKGILVTFKSYIYGDSAPYVCQTEQGETFQATLNSLFPDD